MSKKDEALKLALEALEASLSAGTEEEDFAALDLMLDARKTIKEALAESALERMAENERELGLDYMEPHEQPEAVGEFEKAEYGDFPVLKWRPSYVAKIGDKLYTSPQPSKPWAGLTAADLDKIDAPIRERGHATIAEIYRAIEAKLREKNNG